MTHTAEQMPHDFFLKGLLDEQQSLSAVDRFAQKFSTNDFPDGEKIYRDLIPVSTPKENQQYAFEIDLDACSGCKACVAACHSLNGLEENESWRHVGQLVGGTGLLSETAPSSTTPSDTTNELPILQHVTTACHHCIEPACLDGCPVNAYEKDLVTGIVRHLDDQCIGCQYCILKCPYDVPVYSPSKGIVRKCDMCHQRLAVGEAPACVQSCPNEAIRIRLVDRTTVVEESEAGSFFPTAPDPSDTIPTTVYQSRRPFPRNTLPADYFAVQRGHGHLPLVFMLVLTQMSVGAFFVEQVMSSYFSLFRESTFRESMFHEPISISVRPLHLCAALFLGLLGMGASLFHLGRPLYAFRAVLGLRRSWLSREIVAFGIFAVASSAYVGCALSDFFGVSISQRWVTGLGMGASASGLLAVGCSIMIYVDTHRPCWRLPTTSAKFLLTALTLGIPVSLLILLVEAGWASELTVPMVMADYGRQFCQILLLVTSAKMLLELSALLHLRSRQLTPQKRSALLMTGQLGMVSLRRFFFGVVGGFVLPFVLLGESFFLTGEGTVAGAYHPLFVGCCTLLMLILLMIGELHERYLFFAASVSPKMPGGPAA